MWEPRTKPTKCKCFDAYSTTCPSVNSQVQSMVSCSAQSVFLHKFRADKRHDSQSRIVTKASILTTQAFETLEQVHRKLSSGSSISKEMTLKAMQEFTWHSPDTTFGDFTPFHTLITSPISRMGLSPPEGK